MNDVRVKDLIEAHRQTERYAGELERKLERVLAVCSLASTARFDQLGDVVDVIAALAAFKDSRTRIFTGAFVDGKDEQG